ncbi:hypothetical protein JCM5350_006042 [Sporobolomyces pararoseus]
MSNPPSPSGTFVPQKLFGTTFQQTSDILTAFYNWTEADPSSEESKARSVRDLIDQHTKSGSPQRNFWDQAYQSVQRWTTEFETYSFSIGLRPFTFLVDYNNRSSLESVMDVWWTPSGAASKKAFPLPTSSSFPSPAQSDVETGRSSRSQSRSRSRSLSRSQSAAPLDSTLRDQKPQDATTIPKTSSQSTKPQSPSRRQPSESSSTGPYTFLGNLGTQKASKISSTTPYIQEGRSTRESSFLSQRNTSTSKAARLTSSSFPSPSRRFPQSEPVIIDSGSEQEEENPTLTEDKAQIDYETHLRTLISDSRARALRDIPKHLQSTFSLIERNRRSTNEALVKDLARAGSAYQIPLKARMAMVKYQYVDLRTIYGFDRSATVRSRLLPDDDGLNFHFDPTLPTKEIPSIVAWLDTWDTYSRYIKYLFPALSDDLDDYASWMRYQNTHVYTDRWRAYPELDVYIRKNLTTEHFPCTLTAATNDPTHIIRFLTNPTYINSSSDSSHTSKRPRLASNEICQRYQDGRCPGEPGCRGRIHECENCRGDHPGQDCTGDKAVTIARLEARARASSVTLSTGGKSSSAKASGGGHSGPRPPAQATAAQPST